MEQEVVVNNNPTISDKIARVVNVLKESSMSRFQVIGHLIEANYDKKEIEGYCAMGALGCEIGLIDWTNQSAESGDVMHAYGLRDYLARKAEAKLPKCPYCHNIDVEYDRISDLVIHLNDQHYVTFRGIADALENIDEKLFQDFNVDELEEQEHYEEE